MPVVVGVDSSTQSCKVQVRDADSGTLLSRASAEHPPTSPPRSEQHPADWWTALEPLLDIEPRPVGVSIAAQQHGMVALDAHDEVLRAAKLWNDTESAPQAAALVDDLGADAWATACGSVPVPAFTITKLVWLREVEPDVHAQVRRVLLPHDWLTSRLTGDFTTDRGDASGTGYWSPSSGVWQPQLLALAGMGPEVLPRVLGPRDVAGEWRGAVVGPGTGDNMAGALALAMRPGDVAISLGTSGTVFATAERPVHDGTGAVAGFADATGRFLPLVCTLNATKVTDAVARLLRVSLDELADMAIATPAGACGLVLVPWFDGERTPNRPDATGMLLGLRCDTEPEHLARAAFEGVICGLLEGLDALGANGVKTDRRLLLIGGGARSVAYRKILADLTGRPVDVPRLNDLVAAGACIQAAGVHHGVAPLDISETWEMSPATVVDPSEAVDRDAIRAAYRYATEQFEY